MNKPVRVQVKDDLPALDSGDEEDEDEEAEEWSSGIESLGEDDEDDVSDEEDDVSVSGESDAAPRKKEKRRESDDEEMPYETAPRKRRPSWEPESDKEAAIERLPIKLSDGRVLKSKSKVYLPQEDKEESEDESDVPPPPQEQYKAEDVSTGARFGRPAVVDVVSQKSRKARIQAAKEQIAGLCQEIVSDPENSVSKSVRSKVTPLIAVTVGPASTSAHVCLAGDFHPFPS